MSILRKLAGFADENKNDISVANKDEQLKAADKINCQNQKHCDKCGSAISGSDKFCGGCGAEITVSKKIVKAKTINEKYNFAELSLQEKALYIFLILIFCSIGANIWDCDISIFLAIIICVVSIMMIYSVWGLAKIRNEKCKIDIKKQKNTTKQHSCPSFFKKGIKNILASLIALGLFILAFYIFIILTDNKKTEKSDYLNNYLNVKEKNIEGELDDFSGKELDKILDSLTDEELIELADSINPSPDYFQKEEEKDWGQILETYREFFKEMEVHR